MDSRCYQKDVMSTGVDSRVQSHGKRVEEGGRVDAACFAAIENPGTVTLPATKVN
jgi:hypothetical protein